MPVNMQRVRLRLTTAAGVTTDEIMPFAQVARIITAWSEVILNLPGADSGVRFVVTEAEP